MAPFKRRRLIVDRFQYRLLIFNWVYFLALLLVFAGVVFLPLAIRMQSSSVSFAERQRLAEEFLSLHAHLWPAVFLLFALLSVHSIFVSHRIAGPLFRVRKVLGRVGEGDLSVRLSLRKNDYLVREAQAINEMIEALRTRVSDVKESFFDLDMRLADVEALAGESPSESLQDSVRGLRGDLERFEKALRQFRTQPTEAPPTRESLEGSSGGAIATSEAVRRG